MFSSWSFIVSGLTFASLINFQFIFVYGVINCSSFILLQVADQFSQHHLLKRLSFCIVIVFLCCAKAFKFNQVPFVYFCFYFYDSGGWVIEDPAVNFFFCAFIVVLFAIIFSYSKSCLFTLLIVSFAVQKLLSLIRSHLFTFVFISITQRWVIEDLALIYVMECSAYVFL